MSAYAVVKSGGVVRFLRDLPFTHNGVQGFRSLSTEQQVAHGVLPVVDLTPAFDAQTHRISFRPPAVEVFADRVEITRPIDPI